MTTAISVDELRSLFAYDPDSGSLTWRVDRPPRIKAGTRAGTITPDGYVSVTVLGRKLLGHHIAWALTNGQWPDYRVGLVGASDRSRTTDERRASRSDLRLANIDRQDALLSDTPQAARQREYNERQRYMRAERKALGELRKESNMPNVHFSTRERAWVVLDPFVPAAPLPSPRFPPRDPAKPRPTHDDMGNPITYPPEPLPPAPQQRRLGTYQTQDEAEAAAHEYNLNRRSLELYPPPTDTTNNHVTAGFRGITLGDLDKQICYDSERGVLIWRLNPFDNPEPWFRGGRTANKPNTNGTPTVNMGPKHYPAHLLAWFISYGYWPARKAIGFKDGDRTNFRLDNLYDRNDTK